jgi:GT2 family glycosyltransferase
MDVDEPTGQIPRVGESLQRPSAGVSLIVCSRNRPQLLLQTIESILNGERVPTEIIVIDQSDAPHAELAQNSESRGCRVRYCLADARGVSVARNTGAVSAQQDVLIFIDDDMIVAFDWLGVLVDALIRIGCRGVVTGQVAPADAGALAPSIKVASNPAQYEGRVGSDVLYSGNMGMYRATLIALGGFDDRLGPGTRFPAAEDNDLGFRLLEAGYRIVYVPEAVVYHRSWRSRRDNFVLRYRYGRGQGAFYAKHATLSDPYMLRRLFKDLVLGVRSVARMIVPQPFGAVAEVLYVLGLLTGAAGWLWANRHSGEPVRHLQQ